MFTRENLLSTFLQTASPEELYRGDTSVIPESPVTAPTLADVFTHVVEAQAAAVQACAELYRSNMAFLQMIITQGQDIYDGHGTLIFRTHDPELVTSVLAAVDERHFGMTLTGTRKLAP